MVSGHWILTFPGKAPETLEKGRDPCKLKDKVEVLSHEQNLRSTEEGPSRGGGSCTCREVEVGARWAVHTLKAAGVETHGLFPLPRLAALGTHGHWDLGEEDKKH